MSPDLDDLITSDPALMGGRRVFRGTRVPVEVVFENLADGMTVDEILAEYETQNRDDVTAVLALSSDRRSVPIEALTDDEVLAMTTSHIEIGEPYELDDVAEDGTFRSRS